jgi:hypothetical protein
MRGCLFPIASLGERLKELLGQLHGDLKLAAQAIQISLLARAGRETELAHLEAHEAAIEHCQD